MVVNQMLPYISFAYITTTTTKNILQTNYKPIHYMVNGCNSNSALLVLHRPTLQLQQQKNTLHHDSKW